MGLCNYHHGVGQTGSAQNGRAGVCICVLTKWLNCICGQIEDARVIMDRENPFRSRGFGFVTYSRPEDAQNAIQQNNDKEWQVCV